MSYPRSGNSFCRKFLDQITGVYTGSDMNAKMTMAFWFLGFAAEQVTDNTVWVTKTHHSLEMPEATKFTANKNIAIVRNPIDVMPSLAYLINTTSHGITFREKINEEFPDYWNTWIENNSKALQHFHTVMTKNCASAIPTYFLTYEDLKTNPEPVVLEMFQFLLDLPSLEGTVVEAKIKAICSNGAAATRTYAIKSTSTSLSRNAHMYTEEHLAVIKSYLSEHLYFFGYTNDPTGGDNETAFFTFDEHKDEDKENFMGYKAHNKKVLAELGKSKDKIPEYEMNGDDKMSAKDMFSLSITD